MRRGAGMSAVGPASGGGEVAEGWPGARAGDSRSRGSGFIAGSPDDVCEVAGAPPARGGPLEDTASSRSGRRSLSLVLLSVAIGQLSAHPALILSEILLPSASSRHRPA